MAQNPNFDVLNVLFAQKEAEIQLPKAQSPEGCPLGLGWLIGAFFRPLGQFNTLENCSKRLTMAENPHFGTSNISLAQLEANI